MYELSTLIILLGYIKQQNDAVTHCGHLDMFYEADRASDMSEAARDIIADVWFKGDIKEAEKLIDTFKLSLSMNFTPRLSEKIAEMNGDYNLPFE